MSARKGIRAVFLDRDGVICRRHETRSAERNAEIGRILSRPDFQLSVLDEHRIFFRVFQDPNTPKVVTREAEEAFWWHWGERLLEEQGMRDGALAASKDICARYPYHSMLDPWPEVPAVLETLRANSMRMAVISNTFPSLEASIEAMGLAHHFEAFIASALVGCSKPDPRIYESALSAMGVCAAESVFVDDVAQNADGARDLGFTAFRLDRESTGPDWDNWTIHTLEDLTEYLTGEQA
jgi:HAD superfamily hydrolase (TIGR01509 family)